jgi:hypothetical protein
MRHKWDKETAVGHGGGVVTSRVCARCGATQWRDTGASDMHGRPTVRRGWTDGDGYPCPTRPSCYPHDEEEGRE